MLLSYDRDIEISQLFAIFYIYIRTNMNVIKSVQSNIDNWIDIRTEGPI
jgi:hypothetical protein